jgi:predicted 3-demethylubiquinone-9 3-methyltransferase (glyoxalase superfamily)
MAGREDGTMQRITPCLWLDTEAEEAAAFYTSVFPNSKVLDVSHYGEAGPRPAGMVLTVEFELDGMRMTALNGGPEFRFNEALSLQISCADQDEIDHYWDRLTEGGEASQCGWLKDRYGVSWQVVPTLIQELLADPDPARTNRAMTAMFGMQKLDIAELQRAADAG